MLQARWTLGIFFADEERSREVGLAVREASESTSKLLAFQKWQNNETKKRMLSSWFARITWNQMALKACRKLRQWSSHDFKFLNSMVVAINHKEISLSVEKQVCWLIELVRRKPASFPPTRTSPAVAPFLQQTIRWLYLSAIYRVPNWSTMTISGAFNCKRTLPYPLPPTTTLLSVVPFIHLITRWLYQTVT